MDGCPGFSPYSAQLYKNTKSNGTVSRSSAAMRASPTLLVTRPLLSPPGGHSEFTANHQTGRRLVVSPAHLGPPRHRSRAAARTQTGPSRLALRWGQDPIRSAISSNLATRKDETWILIGHRCLPPLPENPEPSLPHSAIIPFPDLPNTL